MIDNVASHLGRTIEYTEKAEGTMKEAVEIQRNIRKVNTIYSLNCL